MPGELIPIVMFLSIAAVLIFRPLTKRLGSVLEHKAAANELGDSPELERLTRVVQHLVDRMDRLEERVDFTERMLESNSQERQRLLAAMREAGVGPQTKTQEQRR